jgi:2-dehydro-3-deoxygalactonokinase
MLVRWELQTKTDMRWNEGFIAVDWGTTNRRAWRLDPGGRVVDELSDDKGILAVPKDAFLGAVATLNARLGNVPLLLAGMIGSNRGWLEAPYVPAPAGIADLVGGLRWVDPGRIAIVPGVSFEQGERADVMRGEEVQILGAAAAGLVRPDAVVCHPGTHNKWIRLERGRITAFRTVMTGELFNLLKAHSILSDLLAEPAQPGPAFAAGVRHGLDEDDLTAELFSVRARALLGKVEAGDSASYLSGLLIGADLRVGLRLAPEGNIVVMGRSDLTELFAAALAEAGRTCREIEGDEAFLAGARTLAELIS